MINKFEDYINEGVRDKMTPKSDADITNSLKSIFKKLEGKDILDKLQILSDKKVLRYISKDMSTRLMAEALENEDIKNNIKITGQNDEFYLFDNKQGNGMFIFNKNNFKIYYVGLYALKEVVGALNYLV